MDSAQSKIQIELSESGFVPSVLEESDNLISTEPQQVEDHNITDKHNQIQQINTTPKMEQSVSVRFTELNDKNWKSWSIRMKAYFCQKVIWEVISKATPTAAN